MADFSARIRTSPQDQSRRVPLVGPTWICRLRLDHEDHYASLFSGAGYFYPDRTERIFATLLDTSARSLFKPGVVFAIVEDVQVATGIVERPDGLPHPSNNTLPILQTWVQRRPEWFVRARLELTEHSAGWSDLIEDALSTINEAISDQSSNLRVTQVKQKLGGLVIYVRHQLSDAARETLENKLNDVHARSLRTCELCGDHGKLGVQAGFICVRCSACAPEGWSPHQPG